MQEVILAKDGIADFAQTAYLAGAPNFEEADILKVTHRSGVKNPATATVDYTVDAYNATDWADGAKPAAADHAMFNVAARQFKIHSTTPPDVGSLLVVLVRTKGERIKTS